MEEECQKEEEGDWDKGGGQQGLEEEKGKRDNDKALRRRI